MIGDVGCDATQVPRFVVIRLLAFFYASLDAASFEVRCIAFGVE